MLQYKNGRFYAPGVSFALPEGFYLETMPEVCSEYGLAAWTPDKKYYLEWDLEEGCMGTERELTEMTSPDWGARRHSPVTAVQAGALSGHRALYENKNGTFLEVRLALAAERELVVRFVKKAADLREPDVEPYLETVLAGVRPEP